MTGRRARVRFARVSVRIDDSVDLRVELPAGIEPISPDATSDDALRQVERDG